MSGPPPGRREAPADLSVYVHVPFCLRRCGYCDFTTRAVSRVPREAYLRGLLIELALRTRSLPPRPIATVFFGGGTPSLLGGHAIGALLEALDRWGGLRAGAEVTVECNPGAAGSGELSALVAAGVTRLSIGVQSLRDARLKALGRIHDAAEARATLGEVADLLDRGRIASASADLIYGSAGDGLRELERDVREWTPFGLPHLSAYALTVEPATALHARIEAGAERAPDEGVQAAMLLALPGLLAPHLRRYEVSSFARPGHDCRHNVAIWRGASYLALGAGAHGFLPAPGRGIVGRRYGNLPDPSRWRARLNAGRLPEAFAEQIDTDMHLDERVLTGLRLTEGIDLDELRAFAPPVRLAALMRRAEAIQREGRGLVAKGGRLRVTEAGLIALDKIVLDLLA